MRCSPICQRRSWTFLQITTAFHRISPPCSIQAWLQQYCRRPFLYSAYRSFNNTIRLGSMRCWRTTIPWYVFTGFAKFQCVVSINDFRLFRRLEKLAWTPFRLLRSFRFARIRLYPLSGYILYNDCFSVTVSRFTALIENFVILLLSSHRICLPEVLLSSARFLQGALEILVRKHISQFRSFGKWVKIQCFLGATFMRRSESETGKVCARAGTSASSRLSVNSSNHAGRYRNRLLVAWFFPFF